MSKIEAASSLFGASDSGSDFFTAEDGPNSAAESPVGAAESGASRNELPGQDPSDLFDNNVASNAEGSAASLFADAGDVSLFDGAVEQGFGEQTHTASDQQTNAYGHDQGTYQNGNYEATAGAYDPNAGGWYDEHGQWQTTNAGGYYDQYGQWQATNNTYGEPPLFTIPQTRRG